MVGIFDIGSNSVRLGILEEGRTKEKLLRTTRLGEGLSEGVLTEASIRRSIDAMLEMRALAQRAGVVRFFAFATEAVRRAKNGVDFARAAEAETGIPVEILPGETEAEIAYLGGVPTEYGGVFDVGGASTEIYVKTPEEIYRKSVPVGCVILKTACGEDLKKLRAFSEENAAKYGNVPKGTLYGIGGTATTLTAFGLKLEKYDPDRVTGQVVTVNALKKMAEELSAMSPEERVLAGIPRGRSDVIVGGAVWLYTLLETIGHDSFVASDRDNMEGYFTLLKNRGAIEQ